MSYQSAAEAKLLEYVNDKSLSLDKWAQSKFEIFKTMATTEKGDIAEDFFASLLIDNGWSNVEVKKGRRGDYDVIGDKNSQERKFECKTATEDIHGSFQFNGIRYDTKYTHLFCLGISPDGIGFIFVGKTDIGTDDYKLVPMAKGANSAFKLTRKKKLLLSFDMFGEKLEGLVI